MRLSERDPDELVGEDVACEILYCTKKTLQNQRWRGDAGPPYLKLGRRVRYRIGDLVDYLESCRIKPS